MPTGGIRGPQSGLGSSCLPPRAGAPSHLKASRRGFGPEEVTLPFSQVDVELGLSGWKRTEG